MNLPYKILKGVLRMKGKDVNNIKTYENKPHTGRGKYINKLRIL